MDRKEYLRQYQRKWLLKRRNEFFSDKFCVKCKSTDRLELDHIDRDSKIKRSDHSIWSWSEERRNEELKKCQVLCEKCHKIKTSNENSKPITHGMPGYRRNCRCEVCRKAQSIRMKKYKAEIV